jgi:hypothetical protein
MAGEVLGSGTERFTPADLAELSTYVATTWGAATDLDWSSPAGTVEWSCLRTADHAVDCVWAPVFFLASRRHDRYPNIGADMAIGEGATPARLLESLEMATRVLTAVIRDTPPDIRSVIFRRPEILVGAPADFAPRAAVELVLHAHDVCAGLGVEFEPDAELCYRLREHTRPWSMWTVVWDGGLAQTDDPWHDLLTGSGRARVEPDR